MRIMIEKKQKKNRITTASKQEEVLNKLYALDTQNDYYEAKKNSLEIQKKRARRRVLNEKIETTKHKKIQ